MADFLVRLATDPTTIILWFVAAVAIFIAIQIFVEMFQ